MNTVGGLILVLVMLVNFYLIATSRLKKSIQAVALQGALLGLMPLFVGHLSTETASLAVLTLFVKGFAVPGLLFRAMREVPMNRDIAPIVSFNSTMLLLAIATGASLAFTSHLPLIEADRYSLIVPTSISTIVSGVILMVTRRKAISQIVGFISLENGVFAFGLLLLHAVPTLVELGVLLDLLAAIFVMAIIINRVQRTFSSLDTLHLSSLRD